MPTALVLGDAASVYADAEAALALFEPDAIFATNLIAVVWPSRVDYWCTLHPESAENWPGMEMALHRRRQAGLNRPQTWAHKPYRGIDRSTPDWAGSSGLFAVKVAIEEGFERIVLAGVPMTAEGAHYYDAKVWTAAHVFHSGWNHRLPQIKDIVRSMSGWTRELLGEPTRDWLAAR